MNETFSLFRYYSNELNFFYRGVQNIVANETVLKVNHIGKNITNAFLILKLSMDSSKKFVDKTGLFPEIDFDSMDEDVDTINFHLKVKSKIFEAIAYDMIRFPEMKPAILFANILNHPSNTEFLDLEQYEEYTWICQYEFIIEVDYDDDEDDDDWF